MPGSILTPEQDALAISIIRGLAMDAPLKAKSGHQGTAMALAPLGHVLFSRVMKYDPKDPTWTDRDRFILSGGHASILQYALLYLSGYDLTLDDIKNFRQWGSRTPGHPEVGHTAGVEVTTGPLGQGFANAVGMALAERYLRSTFGDKAADHHTYVIMGDGCLMEGISHEAASFAGHQKLDHLIAIFDDNKITIDGSTDLACSDDVALRFKGYGWNVIDLGDQSEDLDAIENALLRAREHTGQPTLITLQTRIGYPSPDFTNKHEAHGNPFSAEHVSRTKSVMGIPDEPFFAPDEIVTACHRNATERSAIVKSKSSAGSVIPDLPTQLTGLPRFEQGESIATRVAIQKAIEASSEQMPGLLIGAADLTGNTGAKDSKLTAQSAANPSGRQIYYGIREHAMGAIAVGLALHGGTLPVVGTFFVFADYMRPAIRLAALSRAKCVFVFSHDSVGVGEDGPTHQPVEHLASLRSIPGLRVIRPADANETIEAWKIAVSSDGPTALVLSRQNLPVVSDGSAVHSGAGLLRDADNAELTLIGTGSEVSVAMAAADALKAQDIHVRVVSMPSWDLFLAQSDEIRKKILPPGIPTLSVEAGTTFGWAAFSDHQIGIDRFGASAPGAEALEKLGISVDAVVAKAKEIRS